MYTTIPSSVCHACMTMYIQLSDIPAIHPPAYAVHVFQIGVHRQHAHNGGKERRYTTGCGTGCMAGAMYGVWMERYGDQETVRRLDCFGKNERMEGQERNGCDVDEDRRRGG